MAALNESTLTELGIFPGGAVVAVTVTPTGSALTGLYLEGRRSPIAPWERITDSASDYANLTGLTGAVTADGKNEFMTLAADVAGTLYVAAQGYSSVRVLATGPGSAVASSASAVSTTPAYNPVSSAFPLRKLSAALGKTRAGNRNTKVLVLGDSTMAGAGVTGVGGFGAGGMPLSMCMRLGAELNRIMMPANAHGWFGEGMRGGAIAEGATGTTATVASYDPRLVFGAGWQRQLIDAGLGGPFFRNTTDTNPLAFTPTAAGSYSANVDTFVVYYVTTSTAGTFSWAIGAGAATNQSCVTGSNGIAKLVIPAGSLAAHTLNLRRVSGNVWIMGVQAYDSTVKQIEVLVAPWNGGFAANFVGTTQPWSAGNMIPFVAPDLTVIQLQINDAAFATPLSTYTANLQSLITIAQQTGDVILRSGYPSAITYNANTPLAKQQLYREALISLASQNGIPYDDLFGRLGSYEIQAAIPGGGMYADTLHPSSPVYSMAAYTLADLIRQY